MPAGSERALILLGHGTRNEDGQREFERLVQQVTERMPNETVRSAYIELQEPSLATVVRQLDDQGVHDQVICPILLLASGHARRDIPQWVDQLHGEREGLRLSVVDPLGTHPAMHQLAARRVGEILEARPELFPDQVVCVLVARGGLDDDLSTQLESASRGRQPHLNISTRIAFLALAEPTWPAVSEELLESPAAFVIVQPYLLFQGRMLAKLALDTQKIQRKAGSRQQWCLAGHLGAEVEVVQAVSDRFREVSR